VSLFARSIVLIVALLPMAGATTITILPAASLTQATADRDSWLSQTFGAGTIANPIEVSINRGWDFRTVQLLTSFHSLYFFMTGVDGNIQLQTGDKTTAYIHDGDDGIYFVGITSPTAIGFVQWNGKDVFGLEDFGTPRTPAATPEPASWLCIATGLAGITRRYRVPSSPSPAAPWIWQLAKLARLLRGGPGPHTRARP
jgi:hypothetical protein